MSTTFAPATRENALRRLDSFIPNMGTVYSCGRNTDEGPNKRHAVSSLSPFVRRRLILEEELIQRALDAHGADKAGKFIQEVVWRGYWKGWLEQRPAVWEDYLYEVADDREKLSQNKFLQQDYENAIQGQTGIACFDTWVAELIETGYLHNHARMWFASIWIFTLRLPWTLGAEFFYHHLLDGDPASNTLSWRWVGGLHTAGKTYLARASNIEKFTNGRFKPSASELAEDAEPLGDPDLPDRQAISMLPKADWARSTALVITEEDCAPELLPLPLETVKAAGTVQTAANRTANGASQAVLDFEKSALNDAAIRLTKAGGPQAASLLDAGAMLDWARKLDVQQIVVSQLPVGTAKDTLLPAFKQLEDQGIPVIPMRRDWDDRVWPHATAGFFKLKKQIPNLLASFSKN